MKHQRLETTESISKRMANDKVFIFCPEKYYTYNSEAKLYEHVLTYEECRKYFDDKDDAWSKFRSQQLEQAVIKARRPSNVK